MTQEHKETAEELFWMEWEDLMNSLTKNEQELVDEMMMRTRKDTFEMMGSFTKNIRELK